MNRRSCIREVSLDWALQYLPPTLRVCGLDQWSRKQDPSIPCLKIDPTHLGMSPRVPPRCGMHFRGRKKSCLQYVVGNMAVQIVISAYEEAACTHRPIINRSTIDRERYQKGIHLE